MRNVPTKVSPLTLLFLLSLATALLYSKGLQGPFLLDDMANIPQDTAISWQSFWTIIQENNSGPLGRPVAIASFLANTQFIGTSAYSFKIVNLFLHLCCGSLVYLLLSQIFSIRGIKQARWIALGAASVWLLHPLLVSTVLYVVQRMTILSALFMLIALNGYLKWRKEGYNQPLLWVALMCWIALWSLLAVLSKETGLLLFAYLILLETTLFQEPSNVKRANLIAFSLPLLIALGACIHYWPSWQLEYLARGTTPMERLYTQVHVLGYYLQLMLWPDLNSLALYHDDFPSYSTPVIGTFLWALGFISLLLLAVCQYKKRPLISLSIGWFFASHLLESTIIPLENVFEHRNYLALLGLLIPLGSIGHNCSRRTLTLLFAVLLIPLASLTYERNLRWQSLETLSQAHLIGHSASFRTYVDIANVSFANEELRAGLLALDEAQRLAPENPGPSVHKLLVSCQLGATSAPMVAQAKEALEQGRDFSYALIGLGLLTAQVAQNPCEDLPADTLTILLETALHNPALAYRPHHTFELWFILGLHHAYQGLYPQAIAAFEQAHALRPDDPRPQAELQQLDNLQKVN